MVDCDSLNDHEVCDGRGACAFYIPHFTYEPQECRTRVLVESLADGARAFKGHPDFADVLAFAAATRSIRSLVCMPMIKTTLPTVVIMGTHSSLPFV